MSDERDSFRRILASTSIMGGATVAAILVGVVRTKLIALAIGPAGMGLMGVLASVMMTGAAIGSMGFGLSGVRQIAASAQTRAIARRALRLASVPLAILAGLAVWLAREPVARFVTGNGDHALAIGLTGLGVTLAVISTGQMAVIQGYQRIGGLARTRIFGALLSLLIGVPAVLYLGTPGIIVAVVAAPLGNVLAALPFLPPAEPVERPQRGALSEQWRHLFALGTVVMVTGSLGTASLVLIRMLVIRGGGIEAAGLYQAAYAISAMNVALVLSAMGTDYFPRLTAIGHDREATARLMNQQLHVALLLGAPILAAMIALAPLVLDILYSGAFVPAAGLLRWQVTGEILKMPGWALGFLLVAKRDTACFLLVECLFVAAYAGGTALLLPLAGLEGAGIAYLFAYACYSLAVVAACRWRHGAGISRRNLVHLALVAAMLVAVTLIGEVSALAAGIAGTVLAAALAFHAARDLDRTTGLVRRLPGLRFARRRSA